MNSLFVLLSVEEERSFQSLAELHTLRLYVTKKLKTKIRRFCLETGYNFKVNFVFKFKNEIIYLLRVC